MPEKCWSPLASLGSASDPSRRRTSLSCIGSTGTSTLKNRRNTPESGEPEDYILERPPSPTAAAALGEIWEVVVPTTVTILRPRRIVESYRELKIDMSTWNGSDLIRGE